MWDLVGRLGGQIRVAGKSVLGWDMSAAFALARALDLDEKIVAELLPRIEAVMTRKINEQIGAQEDG